VNGAIGAGLFVTLIVAGGLVGDPGAPSMDAGAVPVEAAVYPTIAQVVAADPVVAPAYRVTTTTSSTTTTTVLPVPVNGDCESWRPLVEAAGITDWEGALYVMRRETGGLCNNPHAYRRSTSDDSYGNFQINLWGANEAAWAAVGFPRDRIATVQGSIDAAAFLWKACGWSPWRKPYDCPGGWPL